MPTKKAPTKKGSNGHARSNGTSSGFAGSGSRSTKLKRPVSAPKEAKSQKKPAPKKPAQKAPAPKTPTLKPVPAEAEPAQVSRETDLLDETLAHTSPDSVQLDTKKADTEVVEPMQEVNHTFHEISDMIDKSGANARIAAPFKDSEDVDEVDDESE